MARRRRPAEGEAPPETRAQLLEEWVHRLEERDLLFHVLAGYELRKIYGEYCPPIHLQQLKKAIVNREEAKRIEQILEQFPARKISMKRWTTLRARSAGARTKRRLRSALQFAEDLMRLRRDRRNYQHVASWMERINLVRSEQSRELSRVEQEPLRISASGRGPPGGRPGSSARGDQGGCARLDRDHQGPARSAA